MVEFGSARLEILGDSGDSVAVGLRPEHLYFADSGIPATIVQLEPMGREILYVCETPLGLVRVLETAASASHSIGTKTHFGFDKENTLVFDSASEKLLEDVRVRGPVPKG